MKACGVIAEYNPFHQGHRYQLEKARSLSKAEVMVVAMSGNFVQRGEPAIENKWSRTHEALQFGADLVLEIPTLASCQASDWFARFGVGMLVASNCQVLSFGVESASTIDFGAAYQEWQVVQATLNHRISQKKYRSLSYARGLSLIVEEILGKESHLYRLLQNPNQQLGFSYLKAIFQAQAKLAILPILRNGKWHHDQEADTNQFASGTALRKQLLLLKDKEILEAQLPYFYKIKEGMYQNHWEQYWDVLYYQLQRSSLEELREIYQMEEGIEYRLIKALRTATSFNHFIELIKNKRWTWARLQRLCVYILLGITKRDVECFISSSIPFPDKITVLGFNSVGQSYLKELKSDSTTFITNYADETLKNQQRYDAIYDLKNPSKYVSHKQFKPVNY